MTNDQAVAAQADGPEIPVSEDAGAQESEVNELDAALSEYEQAEQAEAPAKKTDAPEDSRLERIERELIQADVSTAAERIAGDTGVGNGLAEAFLELKAKHDPRVVAAFNARKSNPDGWNKVLGGIAKELSKQVGAQADQGVTDDRAALSAAVRGNSKPAPEKGLSEKSLARMSTSEFNKFYEDTLKG